VGEASTGTVLEPAAEDGSRNVNDTLEAQSSELYHRWRPHDYPDRSASVRACGLRRRPAAS
jgi:hypothetical protein